MRVDKQGRSSFCGCAFEDFGLGEAVAADGGVGGLGVVLDAPPLFGAGDVGFSVWMKQVDDTVVCGHSTEIVGVVHGVLGALALGVFVVGHVDEVFGAIVDYGLEAAMDSVQGFS